MTLTISVESDSAVKRGIQQTLTALLPDWFNQGDASLKYAEKAEVLPGYVAWLDGEAKGLLLYKQHAAIAAEIFWLAVDPGCHRSGIGRALVSAARDAARRDGLRFLVVWTLHSSSKQKPFEATRLFYEGVGFHYLMEERFTATESAHALYINQLADR